MNQQTVETKQVAPVTTPQPQATVRHGLIAGLFAGVVFAVFEMIAAAAMGASVLAPFQMFASVLLGVRAMEGSLTLGVFLVGLIVHFVLAGAFGALWGTIVRAVSPEVRQSFGAHSALAAGYGLALWLVNFQIIARILYPWFLAANQLVQIVLHMVCYGLPLGLFLVARLRPMGRLFQRRVTP